MCVVNGRILLKMGDHVCHHSTSLAIIAYILFSFIDPAFALWPTIKQSAQQVVPEENVARHINRLVQEFLGCVANDCLLIHYANLIWCSATDTDNIQGRLDEIVNSVIHNTADILPSRVEFLESIRRILGWYVYTVVAIVYPSHYLSLLLTHPQSVISLMLLMKPEYILLIQSSYTTTTTALMWCKRKIQHLKE